jgi:Rieske Fe-S protein
MAKQENSQNNLPRRRFLNRLWLWAGSVALLEWVGVSVAFLKSRQKENQAEENIIIAGSLSDFTPDSVTAFQAGKFYLVRLSDGGLLALSRKCTHLGCTVLWIPEEKKFICPCHASAFDMQGKVITPPARHALDPYPISVKKGLVRVNVSKIMKRTASATSKVVYPRS